MQYTIEITPIALELLSKIKDQKVQEGLKKRIEKLASEPAKQGKALSGQLKGYRSVRALGQRYRIIYRINQSRIAVIIVGAGIRKEGAKKDSYAILNKFLAE